jgi:hypothetical protein
VIEDGQAVAAVVAVFTTLTGAISALFLSWKGTVEWSEERAWQLVTELRREAAETTKVMEKLADSVRDLKEAFLTEAPRRTR